MSEEQETESRLELGNAWMMCNECGSKLYDFDGHEDQDISCPFRKGSKCVPTDTSQDSVGGRSFRDV